MEHNNFKKISIYDNMNPYHVRDGKWGGMGIQYWFNNFENLPSRNVYEKSTECISKSSEESIIRPFWNRVWDNDKNKWRKLNNQEKKLLPKLSPRKIIYSFEKYILPIIDTFNAEKFKTLNLYSDIKENENYE